MRRLPAIAVAAAVLLLTGCSAAQPTPSPTSSDAPTVTPTPTATPTPEPESLVVGIDGISYEHTGGVETVPYTHPDLMLDLLTAISDEEPEASEVEDLPGYASDLMRYDFDGVVLITSPEGPASVSVTTPDFHDVRVATPEGVKVGDTREAVLALGGRDGVDADQDGVAEWLELGALEVPDTRSLVRPDAVGVMFVLLGLDGDVVREIQAPGNDFADI